MTDDSGTIARTLIAIAVMSLCAGWTRGTCGFGMGIAMNAGICVSGLLMTLTGAPEWRFPMYQLVCLITIIDVAFIPALSFSGVWDYIHILLAWILAIPRAVFLVLGTFVLLRSDSALLNATLGVLVTAFAIWQWLFGSIREEERKRAWRETQRNPRCFYFWAVVASSISGVTSGFAGVTSPPIQILVLLGGMPKSEFRATWIAVNSILKPLQLVILFTLKPKAFTSTQMPMYAVAIAFAWAGFLFGNWCHAQITETTARSLLLLLLSVSSGLLLLHAHVLVGVAGTAILVAAACGSLCREVPAVVYPSPVIGEDFRNGELYKPNEHLKNGFAEKSNSSNLIPNGYQVLDRSK